MKKIIQGKAYVFGNNIDTDQIYPGRYLELTEAPDIAKHVLEGADSSFAGRYLPGGIVVGGRNFGCGSSREHAAIAIKAAGIPLVVAESFARIFYRNCINLGLPLLVCPGISAACKEGDELSIDIEAGTVRNLSSGITLKGQGLSEYVWKILSAGGIKPLLRAEISSRG